MHSNTSKCRSRRTGKKRDGAKQQIWKKRDGAKGKIEKKRDGAKQRSWKKKNTAKRNTIKGNFNCKILGYKFKRSN